MFHLVRSILTVRDYNATINQITIQTSAVNVIFGHTLLIVQIPLQRFCLM